MAIEARYTRLIAKTVQTCYAGRFSWGYLAIKVRYTFACASTASAIAVLPLQKSDGSVLLRSTSHRSCFQLQFGYTFVRCILTKWLTLVRTYLNAQANHRPQDQASSLRTQCACTIKHSIYCNYTFH